MMVQQIFDGLNEADKEELLLIMNELPPKGRKRRQLVKERARKILRGEKPYAEKTSVKSEIRGVSYDASKNCWLAITPIKQFKKLGQFKTEKEAAQCLDRFYKDLNKGALKLSEFDNIKYSYKYEKWILYIRGTKRKYGLYKTLDEAIQFLPQAL